MVNTTTRFTQIKDHWSEQRLFVRRIIMCAIMVVGLSGLVIGRLIQLQIVDFEYYSVQSQGNRIQVQPLPPTRGLIFDRNGRVLAENLPTHLLVGMGEHVDFAAGRTRRELGGSKSVTQALHLDIGLL